MTHGSAPIALISGDLSTRSWHSVDYLHATGKNRWKDWYCSAGIRSLYIDFDGNVFAGTCRVGGWWGNILAEGPNPNWTPGKWVKCNLENCQCGSDMFSPKVKRKELIPNAFDDLYQRIDAQTKSDVHEVSDPEVIVSKELRFRNWVTWDIGRRCNYDCSYCFPDAHNNYEAHKSLGSLKHAADWLYRCWAPNLPIKFVITGGEPTLNPRYLEFAEYLMSRTPYSNGIQTTTNGSRNAEYFSRLMRVSAITFSAHLERLEDPEAYSRFIENVRACVETKKQDKAHKDAALNWLLVKIMLKPGSLKLAERLLEDVRKIPGFDRFGTTSTSLLHLNTDKARLKPYSDKEFDFVKLNS